MTRLSVNLNKVATLRNARGGNIPNLIQVAEDVQSYGAQGITVHPRPDERHIKYSDVRALKAVVSTEFNIEGNPVEDKFVQLVLEVCPDQVTLVPDATGQLTSDHGWNTVEKAGYLKEVLKQFADKGIRTSIFVDPISEMVEGALEVGADRVELYTEGFAAKYAMDKESAVLPYCEAAATAVKIGIGLNAGHDLNLDNLAFFASRVQGLQEVSIGHALISDALYYGLDNIVKMYLNCLRTKTS